MTEHSPQSLPVGAAILLDALPHPPGCTDAQIAQRRNLAIDMVADLGPRDTLEEAQALRIVALQFAVMENFRLAAQPDMAVDQKTRLQGRILAMSRMIESTQQALFKRQAGPALRPLPKRAWAEAGVETPELALVAEAPGVEALGGGVPRDGVPMAAAEADAEPVAEAAAPTGWVAKRLQDLDVKVTQGKPLTPAQQEWLRRQATARTESSAAVLAA